MHDVFERASTALIAEPPRPAPTMDQLCARVRRRRRRRTLAMTAPACLLLAVGWITVARIDPAGEVVVSPSETSLDDARSPLATVTSPDSTSVTIPTGADEDGTGDSSSSAGQDAEWPFAAPSETEMGLLELLDLPAGWSITRADSTTAAEPPVTTQRWGVESDAPLLYDQMVELFVRPAGDQHLGSDIEFVATGFGSSVQAVWADDESYYVANAVGLDADQALAFVEGLSPRDPDDAMAGFDPPESHGMQLVEEYIADRHAVRTTTTLSVDVRDSAGGRAYATIADRPGLPLLVGVGTRRMRIGDHVGVVSPPDFPGLQIAWAAGSVQFSVSVLSSPDDQTASAIAGGLAATPTESWREHLGRVADEPIDVLASTVIIDADADAADPLVRAVASQLHERGGKVLPPSAGTARPVDGTAVHHRADAADAAIEVLVALGLDDPDLLRLGLPGEHESAEADIVIVLGDDFEQLVAAAAANRCAGRYTVLPGDNPARIADRFDITVEALHAANPDVNWEPSVGETSTFIPGNELAMPATIC